MKIEAPVNPNYAAIVVRVRTLVPLAGLDNLVGFPTTGYQAIVGKDTQIGDLGILFPPETQLSDEYTKANSLYRHGDLNADPDKKGYLEDNRRVRAIKFKGNRSDALFMPLSSIDFATAPEVIVFHEGDSFDRLNGVPLCCKFERRPVRLPSHGRPQFAKERRVDERFFPEQFDISNYFRVDRNLDPQAHVVVTQKLHGTNIRVGNIPVARKLTWLDRIAKALGAKVEMVEYAKVYGSHHVIKDAENPDQNHFYDTDLWTQEGSKISETLPKGFMVFGELIGYVPGTNTPIQKHYTYDCGPGTAKLYVYRVVTISPTGLMTDLSWEATKAFCAERGLNTVPELAAMEAVHLEGAIEQFLDTKFTESSWMRFRNPVPLSLDSPCDEGVCLRIEGYPPTIVKAKSSIFLQHETKMLDADVPQDPEEERPNE